MKPVLFIDFDGTLCFDRFWRSADPETFKKIQSYLFLSKSEMVYRWMLGKYTAEEINVHIADQLGISHEPLFKLFVQDCETMRIERSALEKISLLRSRYSTVLMTDNMDCFSRFTVPSLKLGDYFDAIINSYYEKRSKNHAGGKLFIDVLARQNSPIAGSILIDNSKPTCEIFGALGGTSLFVSKEKTLSHWLKIIDSGSIHA